MTTRLSLPFRSLSLGLMCVMFISGCAPHRVAPRTEPYSTAQVQRFVDSLEIGQRVQVWTADGSRQDGKLTWVDTDLLCFRRVRIPWEQVVQIEFRSKRGSAPGDGWAPGGVIVAVVVVAWLAFAILVGASLRHTGLD